MRSRPRLRPKWGVSLFLWSVAAVGLSQAVTAAAPPAKAEAAPAVVELRVQPTSLVLENRDEVKRVVARQRSRSAG